jgi:hypothetical protein
MDGTVSAPRLALVALAATALALSLLPGVALAQDADRRGLENSCPEGDVPESGFVDVAGNVHEAAIHCAAWWGITAGGPAGRPENQYGPELQVRRDQMASFVARMMDAADFAFPLPPWDQQNRFEDVSDDNPHVAAINRLAQVGIVEGREDNTYGPGEPVRRDQMASFIARAIRHSTLQDRSSDEDQFDDVDEGNPHWENVNGLHVEGIVFGVAEGLYAPAETVRRDAMSAFVMRALDLYVDEGHASPPDVDDDDDDDDDEVDGNELPIALP